MIGPDWKANIAVLGSGPFALMMTAILANRPRLPGPVRLCCTDPGEAERLRRDRVGRVMGRPFPLPDPVEIVTHYESFESGPWALFVAVPSREFEDTMDHLIHHLDPGEADHLLLILTKGLLTRPTRRRFGIYTFSQYAARVATNAGIAGLKVAVANGPSLLAEIYAGQHSFFQIGAESEGLSAYLETMLASESITVSASRDMIGVELGGALKNPIAIACGMAAILPGAASNVQGVLLSQGFKELFHFATTLGARPATLLGPAGLADVVTTSTSANSRNRSYGMQFMRRALMNENDPGLIERLELFLRPTRFIEREVLENQELVEGAFSLTPILEIAEEFEIDMPLYTTLFDILTRRSTPAALIRMFNKSAGAGSAAFDNDERPGRRADPGNIAGQNFRRLIEKRTVRQVLGSRGMQNRIHRQSINIVKNLGRRLEQAHENENRRELEILPHEISLWQRVCMSRADHIREHIEELIEFYVDEISDNYLPGIRGALIHTIGPLRTILGGLRPGSGVPYTGGEIEELRSLSARYNILYAPTHRSHLDSVEVAFGLYGAGLPLPRYAAGSNLMSGPFWKWILKSLGAFAVDRERTRNILYLECLTRYATMMLEAGIPSLVYPEGTRSRSGAITPLKTGLLTTAIDAFRNSGNEILIVPVAVSYENVPEDCEFAGLTDETKFQAFIRNRTAVYVDLCEAIRVSQHMNAEEPGAALGAEITRAWNKQLRVLPNHIVARALIEIDGARAVSLSELEDRVSEYVDRHRNANLLTRQPARIVSDGVRVLKKRRFINVKKGQIEALEPACLRYYAGMAAREI